MFKEKNIFFVGLVFLVAVLSVFYFLNKDGAGKRTKNTEIEIDKNAIEVGMNGESRDLRLADESDHISGSIKAPVQLIVYIDFSNQFCAEFDEAVKEAQKEFGDKLVVVSRHFFSRSNQQAMPAAIASECADEQGKFWEMHDKIFSRGEKDFLGENLFKKYAEEINLDEDKFSDCLGSEKYKDKILSQIKEAGDFGVIGSPTSFLNGKILPGAYQFKDFIDSQGRERKGLESLINMLFKD